MGLSALSPSGPLAEVPNRFVWSGARSPDRITLVVCDASYAEVARLDDLSGSEFVPPATLAARLLELRTFHWFVERTDGDRTVRSRFESCEIH